MKGRAIVLLLAQDKINEVNKITSTPEAAQDTVRGVSEAGSTWNNFVQLIGLVFLLIIILIATYYTTRFVGKVKMGQLKNSNFTIIDTYRISQNKLMQIVRVGNKYIVIAIGKDSINYITELDEKDIIFRDEGQKDVSFLQIFEKLKNKGSNIKSHDDNE